ncbi:SusD family [Candidatus Ornithobacterium hominis]|uniref:RagB/SusD family nutrient uptake outer membrane protein n=1 Tax=Candidatus Ornithobacterium hominis TaxID=2497989 RepID=UPI000E5C4FD1|nr:RagB/SusD family nutrient uptake outer membrane protein [Candidatus Ornithobacterium hominis]SZD71803.1 SusD family [Candidatus Ornithobacterium hominis]
MKNISKYILPIAIGLSLASCTGELEKEPHTQLTENTAFNNLLDAQNWVNGMYSGLRGSIANSNTIPQDIQADQLNATVEFGNRFGNEHSWINLQTSYGTFSAVWAGHYENIANINKALGGFPNIKTKDDAEKAAIENYKGELLAARAYHYSYLVRRFAKPYNPASAATDLGLPLTLTFDLKALPARSSMKETYEQILKDLQQAREKLPAAAGKPMAIKINQDFIDALEARTKLYMQDWQGAKTAAEKLINSGTYSLTNNFEGLKNLWEKDNSLEIIFQSFVQAPDELALATPFSTYVGFRPDSKKYQPDYLPTQTTIDLFDDKDYRKDIYFKKVKGLFQGVDYENVTIINKFPGNPALFTEANSKHEHAPKAFRLAETYLIAAEASYELNDESTAKKYLNELRVARGLDATNATGTNLRDEIRNERTRELAFEGFRLDDLKRWKINIERKTPQNLEYLIVNPAENFYQMNRAFNHFMTVWPIPSNDIQINPNLIQNEGW